MQACDTWLLLHAFRCRLWSVCGQQLKTCQLCRVQVCWLEDRPRCSVSICCWECTGQPGCPQLTGCRQTPCCSTVESSVHHTADHRVQGASTVSACCGACVMDQSSDAVQAAICPQVVCGFEQRNVHVPGHVAESCCNLGCAAEDAAASTCRSVAAAGQCSESVMVVLPQ